MGLFGAFYRNSTIPLVQMDGAMAYAQDGFMLWGNNKGKRLMLNRH